MSGEAVGWAFRRVQMDDATAKFVLVAICNYADGEDKAWPSHEQISRLTGLSKRAVQNSIKKLVDWGVIKRIRQYRENGSESNPTVYLDLDSRPVVMGGIASGATPTVQEVPPDDATDATLKTTNTKPQKNPPPKPGEYSGFFERNVWQPYPRKTGTSKKDAHREWLKLSEVDRKMVVVAIPLFAAQMQREGRSEDKIKHLQFWLTGRVFETIAPGAAPGMGPAEIFDPAKQTPEQWRRVLDRFASNHNWNAKVYGPEPGQPGCLVPSELLDPFRLVLL